MRIEEEMLSKLHAAHSIISKGNLGTSFPIKTLPIPIFRRKNFFLRHCALCLQSHTNDRKYLVAHVPGGRVGRHGVQQRVGQEQEQRARVAAHAGLHGAQQRLHLLALDHRYQLAGPAVGFTLQCGQRRQPELNFSALLKQSTTFETIKN